MSLAGKALQQLNRVLALGGLQMSRLVLDFDDRLESPAHLALLHDGMARAIADWCKSQTVIAAHEIADLRRDIEEFYNAFLDSPFRLQLGQSRYNNCLWLFALARLVRPDIIIDSGSYTGASAWALQKGAPAAKLVSFDIDLSNLCLRVPGVQYVEADWTSFDLSKLAGASERPLILAFFDDHVDQARRLLEAHATGVSIAVFDDDFTLGAFPMMAHNGAALPKVEFVLDERLVDGEEIVWRNGNRLSRWKIDRAYLDRARAVIRKTERVPNTSLLTGIHQTPFRVVALHRDIVLP